MQNEPAGHVSQEADPALKNLPAGQAEQEAIEMRPREPPPVPVGQGRQAALVLAPVVGL